MERQQATVCSDNCVLRVQIQKPRESDKVPRVNFYILGGLKHEKSCISINQHQHEKNVNSILLQTMNREKKLAFHVGESSRVKGEGIGVVLRLMELPYVSTLSTEIIPTLQAAYVPATKEQTGHNSRRILK